MDLGVVLSPSAFPPPFDQSLEVLANLETLGLRMPEHMFSPATNVHRIPRNTFTLPADCATIHLAPVTEVLSENESGCEWPDGVLAPGHGHLAIQTEAVKDYIIGIDSESGVCITKIVRAFIERVLSCRTWYSCNCTSTL